ncbi:MAG: phosphate ABC transporter permease PtsA [Chloroflexota bacterium]
MDGYGYRTTVHYRRRKVVGRVFQGLTVLSAGLSVGVLFAVLGFVFVQGVSGLNLELLTQTPKPPGEPGGGVANAVVGTLLLVALACGFSLPVGIGAGIYLAEYGRSGVMAQLIRFIADVLTGVPSIVVGLFAYTVLVIPLGHFSALAGSFALGLIMLPTVVRATEEMLRLVPNSIREAGLALGIPGWKVTLRIVLPTALNGILTGILLAVARAAGETAPLLFTAFGNPFWNLDPTQPVAALPLQIFVYAISPYDDWHRQAWAGALVLVCLVLVASLAARLVRGRVMF